jgi:hypothetical protein
LGSLARSVNDLSTDAGRQQLIGLVPWLVGATVPAGASVTSVAALVGRSALGHVDPVAAARLAPALAAINEPLRPERWPRYSCWRRRRQAVRLVRSAARALSNRSDGDDRLIELLIEAINLSRGLAGLPDLPATDDIGTYPRALPVRVELRVQDGADWPSFYCTALLDRWPVELQEAWQLRAAELQRLEHQCTSFGRLRTPLAARSTWGAKAPSGAG